MAEDLEVRIQELQSKVAALEAQMADASRQVDAFAWATITWVHTLASSDISLLQAVSMVNEGRNFRTNDDLRKRLLSLAEIYNNAKAEVERNRPASEGAVDG